MFRLKKCGIAMIIMAAALIMMLAAVGCESHTHTFAEAWTSDNDNHWHTATCGDTDERGDVQAHTYDSNFKCTVCGQSHTHTFDVTWSADDSGHWLTVTCGHDEAKNVAEHDYDKNYRCKECGYQHYHTYEAELTKTEEGHWYKCTCGHINERTIEKSDHIYDDNFVCTICSYQHVHTFDENRWSSDISGHWHPTTCSNHDPIKIESGVIPHEFKYEEKDDSYNCKDCFYTHIHTYEQEWQKDDTYHWHNPTCTHNDDNDVNETYLKGNISAHRYLNDACGICSVPEPKAEAVDLEFRELYKNEKNEYEAGNGEVDGNKDPDAYEVAGLGTVTSSYVIIPSTHEGKPVVSIGEKAFYNEPSFGWMEEPSEGPDPVKITYLVIPDSVIEIKKEACYECKELFKVTIGKGVKRIWYQAFANCTKLEEIVFAEGSELQDIGYNTKWGDPTTPDPKNWGGRTFVGCEALKKLVLPEGLKDSYNADFDGLKNLEELYIPSTMNNGAGFKAFSTANSLKRIKFGGTMKKIPAGAFASSSSVEDKEMFVDYPGSLENWREASKDTWYSGPATTNQPSLFRNEDNWFGMGNHKTTVHIRCKENGSYEYYFLIAYGKKPEKSTDWTKETENSANWEWTEAYDNMVKTSNGVNVTKSEIKEVALLPGKLRFE